MGRSAVSASRRSSAVSVSQTAHANARSMEIVSLPFAAISSPQRPDSFTRLERSNKHGDLAGSTRLFNDGLTEVVS